MFKSAKKYTNPAIGELRWNEELTIHGDVVTKREKTLQVYSKNSWGTSNWYDVGTEIDVYQYPAKSAPVEVRLGFAG
jgi:hypothetical protein